MNKIASRLKKIVFFASGSGTNFQSVINATQSDAIEARITGLITNKANIGAIVRAEKNDIPVKVIAPSSFNTKRQYETRLLQVLDLWQPELIVLAGYMLKIPEAVINAYEGKIINIHPSLLPKFGGKGFYGMNVHKAVLENGEEESGCSVHVVTQEYDQGPVLGQRKVPIYDSETPESLAERVLQQEHQLLPEVIDNYLNNLNK